MCSLSLLVVCCLDEREIDLPSDDPKIVIDALLSNISDQSYVNIGWTAKVNSRCTDNFGNVVQCQPETFNGPFKVKGKITLIEENTSTKVELPFNMDDKKGMIQIKPNIQAVPGYDYSIEVRVDYENKVETYSAKTTALPTPEIEDISYVIRRGDIGKSDNMVPRISFTDPAVKNFYLFQLCSIYRGSITCGNSRVWSYSLIADTFLPEHVKGLSIDDGASIAKYAEFYPPPEPDFGAQVKMYSVDEVTYDFYKSLIDQFNNDGGAYSPTPSTVKGNFTGNSIGLFRAVQESSAIVNF